MHFRLHTVKDITLATNYGMEDEPAAAALVLTTAPRVMGRIQEYDPQVESITTYLEGLQLYFVANGVEEARRVPVLLTLIGAKVYGTLRRLLAPALPQDKDFDTLLAVLKSHFDPKPLVIAKRFRFYKRNQSSTETNAEFEADLRRLSI